MIFDNIRVGNYVRFNEGIKYLYFRLDEEFMWVDEPLDCLLEVHETDNSSRTIKLRCTSDCGQHSRLKFSEEEYDLIEKQLGKTLLFEVGMAEAFGTYKAPSPIPYIMTVDDNIKYVTKLINRKVQ